MARNFDRKGVICQCCGSCEENDGQCETVRDFNDVTNAYLRSMSLEKKINLCKLVARIDKHTSDKIKPLKRIFPLEDSDDSEENLMKPKFKKSEEAASKSKMPALKIVEAVQRNRQEEYCKTFLNLLSQNLSDATAKRRNAAEHEGEVVDEGEVTAFEDSDQSGMCDSDSDDGYDLAMATRSEQSKNSMKSVRSGLSGKAHSFIHPAKISEQEKSYDDRIADIYIENITRTYDIADRSTGGANNTLENNSSAHSGDINLRKKRNEQQAGSSEKLDRKIKRTKSNPKSGTESPSTKNKEKQSQNKLAKSENFQMNPSSELSHSRSKLPNVQKCECVCECCVRNAQNRFEQQPQKLIGAQDHELKVSSAVTELKSTSRNEPQHSSESGKKRGNELKNRPQKIIDSQDHELEIISTLTEPKSTSPNEVQHSSESRITNSGRGNKFKSRPQKIIGTQDDEIELFSSVAAMKSERPNESQHNSESGKDSNNESLKDSKIRDNKLKSVPMSGNASQRGKGRKLESTQPNLKGRVIKPTGAKTHEAIRKNESTTDNASQRATGRDNEPIKVLSELKMPEPVRPEVVFDGERKDVCSKICWGMCPEYYNASKSKSKDYNNALSQNDNSSNDCLPKIIPATYNPKTENWIVQEKATDPIKYSYFWVRLKKNDPNCECDATLFDDIVGETSHESKVAKTHNLENKYSDKTDESDTSEGDRNANYMTSDESITTVMSSQKGKKHTAQSDHDIRPENCTCDDCPIYRSGSPQNGRMQADYGQSHHTVPSHHNVQNNVQSDHNVQSDPNGNQNNCICVICPKDLRRSGHDKSNIGSLDAQLQAGREQSNRSTNYQAGYRKYPTKFNGLTNEPTRVSSSNKIGNVRQSQHTVQSEQAEQSEQARQGEPAKIGDPSKEGAPSRKGRGAKSGKNAGQSDHTVQSVKAAQSVQAVQSDQAIQNSDTVQNNQSVQSKQAEQSHQAVERPHATQSGHTIQSKRSVQTYQSVQSKPADQDKDRPGQMNQAKQGGRARKGSRAQNRPNKQVKKDRSISKQRKYPPAHDDKDAIVRENTGDKINDNVTEGAEFDIDIIVETHPPKEKKDIACSCHDTRNCASQTSSLIQQDVVGGKVFSKSDSDVPYTALNYEDCRKLIECFLQQQRNGEDVSSIVDTITAACCTSSNTSDSSQSNLCLDYCPCERNPAKQVEEQVELDKPKQQQSKPKPETKTQIQNSNTTTCSCCSKFYKKFMRLGKSKSKTSPEVGNKNANKNSTKKPNKIDDDDSCSCCCTCDTLSFSNTNISNANSSTTGQLDYDPGCCCSESRRAHNFAPKNDSQYLIINSGEEIDDCKCCCSQENKIVIQNAECIEVMDAVPKSSRQKSPRQKPPVPPKRKRAGKFNNVSKSIPEKCRKYLTKGVESDSENVWSNNSRGGNAINNNPANRNLILIYEDLPGCNETYCSDGIMNVPCTYESHQECDVTYNAAAGTYQSCPCTYESFLGDRF